MFYSYFSLSKKGPLARIWLAAHWDKKLTKAQVFETNIETSVDGILQPKVQMALRTSGHLLLGVVRIYSRKAKYLLADCNEAFIKIKMVFRFGIIDLPEDNHIVATNDITLPEVFHDFDIDMLDFDDVDFEAQFSLNQSSAEKITLLEEYNINSMVLKNSDFNLGNEFSEVDNSDLLCHGIEDSLLFSEDVDHLINRIKEPIPFTSAGSEMLSKNSIGMDAPIKSDLFGGNIDQFITNHFFQTGGLYDNVLSAPMDKVNGQGTSNFPSFNAPNQDDDDNHFMPPSPGRLSSNGSRPISPVHLPFSNASTLGLIQWPMQDQTLMSLLDIGINDLHNIQVSEDPEPINEQNTSLDQTNLVHNEEECFALAPVDASALIGLPTTKIKRKLIVDEVKNISGEEIKAQFMDTRDIVITLDLAPPSKRLTHWKVTGGIEKLFAFPGKKIPALQLTKNYQRHLKTKKLINEGLDDVGDIYGGKNNVLQGIAGTVPGCRGRKRKIPIDEQNQIRAKRDVLSLIPEVTPSVESMEVEIPAPLSIAHPTLAISVETKHIEINQQQLIQRQPFITSPFNDNSQILSPGTPAHKSFELNNIEDQFNDFNEVIMDNMGYGGNRYAPAIPGLPSPRGGTTPWNDQDYDYHGSAEEQQAPHETNKQYNERVMNKRANQLYHTIKTRFTQKHILVFDDLTHRNQRREAAQKFYSVLVLKKYKVLDLIQPAPYETIQLLKGVCFPESKL